MMFYREARFLKRSTCACGNPCQSKKFTEVKTLGGGGVGSLQTSTKFYTGGEAPL